MLRATEEHVLQRKPRGYVGLNHETLGSDILSVVAAVPLSQQLLGADVAERMYKHANRGTGIGGWEVLGFEPGKAELEKTTPHHCVMEEGILAEALIAVGVPALVRQSECLLKGAEACRYVITSSITDERWSGGKPPMP